MTFGNGKTRARGHLARAVAACALFTAASPVLAETMTVSVASNPSCYGAVGEVVTTTVTVQNVDVMPPYVGGVDPKMKFRAHPVATTGGPPVAYEENTVACALPQSPGQTATCTHSYTIRAEDMVSVNTQVKLDYYVHWLRLANLQAGNPIVGNASGQKIIARPCTGTGGTGGTGGGGTGGILTGTGVESVVLGTGFAVDVAPTPGGGGFGDPVVGSASLADNFANIAVPVPTPIPPNAGQNGPDVNYLSGTGLTYVVKNGGAAQGWVLMGNDAVTEPYNGDAAPGTMHRIACVRPTVAPAPASYDAAYDPANWRTRSYNRWKKGEVALTRETHRAQDVTKTYANQRCAADLGAGWFWLAFHFDNGQWSHGLTLAQGTAMDTWPVAGTPYSVYDLLADPALHSGSSGNPPESRFLVYIRDQN